MQTTSSPAPPAPAEDALAAPRTALIAALSRVGADGFEWPDAKRDLEAQGFRLEFTWSDCTALYDRVWEHPDVTAYNAGLDMRSADILGSEFFTLYQLRSSHTHLAMAPFTFLGGRIGNTVSYEIWAPHAGSSLPETTADP